MGKNVFTTNWYMYRVYLLPVLRESKEPYSITYPKLPKRKFKEDKGS